MGARRPAAYSCLHCCLLTDSMSDSMISDSRSDFMSALLHTTSGCTVLAAVTVQVP